MKKLHRNSKLSEEMAITTRRHLHNLNKKQVERIARRLGVRVETLRNCAKGITYKYLNEPVNQYWSIDRRGRRPKCQ